MVQVHTKSLRKTSGGLRRSARGKKKSDLGGVWSRTTIGTTKRSTKRTRGDNPKTSLREAEFITLSSAGKSEKVKLLTVMENSANPHFVRRNIITKGAIVQTEKGYAKVTSSPGQDGLLNGVLLSDYKPPVKKSDKKKAEKAAKAEKKPEKSEKAEEKPKK